MKHPTTLLLLIFLAYAAMAQPGKAERTTAKQTTAKQATTERAAANRAAANQWADKQMKQMSLEKRVAQLMFVRVPQSMTKKQQREFDRLFSHTGVGGICFFKGTAAKQIESTRRYQRLSDVPLMVTIDGEWGLGMRLTDCYSFPRQMLMGALPPAWDTLIAQMGEEVGRQCRKVGIHVNFAPVADINNNPRNPVIGCRSFGENKKRVARKAAFYSRALQRVGVMAVGKHFPGHGDTDVDSHLDLPVISHSKSYIDSVDLFPFRHLVNNGIRGMMVAHLQVNAYDKRANMPSSLSEQIVTPLLRQQMNFDGLVFTDGIDMKAVSKNYKDGEGAIRAIRAGSDVILLPIDVEKTIHALVKEAKNDKEFARMIDNSCRRILREKYLCGLHSLNLDKLSVPTKEDNKRCETITLQMAQHALTLVRDENFTLPIQRDETVVRIALGSNDTAVKELSAELRSRIASADKVVMSLHANLSSANNFGVTPETLSLIGDVAAIDSVGSILVIYGSPYILQLFPAKSGTPLPDAIIMGYQNMKEVVDATDAALYGKTTFDGRLPVTAGDYREGLSLKPKTRPKDTRYDRVKEAGMDVACFRKIDSIALNGIAQKAYPGCQVLVARKGRIVYNQCYGRQTYNPASSVIDTNTLFDLASLTKTSATTLAVMKLVDAGKIKLDDRLSTYLPYLKHTNKKHITIRQALSHFARLKAFDAYWSGATTDGHSLIFGSNAPEGFVAIGDSVFIDPAYRNNLLKQIVDSKLEKKERYLYSDLGFILLADLVERVSGQSLDIFMQQHFYGPLKLRNTFFQPIQHGVEPRRIAPTENEKTFRRQQLRGYVHDPNAAAMGGVAGHAGLFSTANDLFRLYQMMLNCGSFEGKQYITPATFNTFNSRHYADKDNRRALGFDKPFINGNSTHVSPMASQSSFGHTGFTGIMVWVDPQYDLIYLFLSNRVYPSATPNKLSSMNIRTDIQDLIYRSIGVK
ncbi:MAG: serine hydrolase [Bacteroidales bacterium]|nr:serine hydrolase [Bacteroidales bacterium]